MKALRRLVSGPLLARLRLCHRMTVNEAMRAGRYGPTFQCGHILYASLDAVEAAEGTKYTEEQIVLASEGKSNCVLTITDREVA